jgi:hypothetical protein
MLANNYPASVLRLTLALSEMSSHHLVEPFQAVAFAQMLKAFSAGGSAEGGIRANSPETAPASQAPGFCVTLCGGSTSACHRYKMSQINSESGFKNTSEILSQKGGKNHGNTQNTSKLHDPTRARSSSQGTLHAGSASHGGCGIWRRRFSGLPASQSATAKALLASAPSSAAATPGAERPFF